MEEQYDDLTGVMTRHSLWEKLEALINEAAKEKTTLTLVLTDLDHFKNFNDTYGHAMGDELIVTFARALQSNCREQDLVGRYGGEEFVVVMPDTLPEEALLMMEDVRRQISTTKYQLTANDKTIEHSFTFSGGIAAFPKDGKDSREVMRAADGALYRAKVNGRDRLALAVKTRMVLKSNYYSKTHLEKLAELAKKTQKTEAFLLREALDDLLVKYGDDRK